MDFTNVNVENGLRVKKKNASEELFDKEKIIKSCMDSGVSFQTSLKVASEVAKNVSDGVTTDDIRRMVADHLARHDPNLAESYMYHSRLMVRTSNTQMELFDRGKIAMSLIKETDIDRAHAEAVSQDVEEEISRLHLHYVTAPLIREIVNVKLLENGLESARARYTRLGMPVYDVSKLINVGSKENANLQHNPETIHKLMADSIAREYALINVLPVELADSHMKGEIHIHDLDYFATRPFCFSHDIRFFLKHGFKADGTGDHASIAGPARRPEVAFLHAAKVLASAQTNCAGGQGFSFFNTFLAPTIEGLEYDRVKQLAQMFIYEMSQMYVARGGQMVFSSIDVDMEVPKMFRDIPAIKLGGKVEKETYADYEEEAKTLFNALLDVYLGGDAIGKPFNFPKLEVQVHPDSMDKNRDALMKVSELSAKFGTPYYIINQPYMPEFACYQCCSFLMPLNESSTQDDVYNGTIRGGGLQVVTINLPQVAYNAGGSDERFFEVLRDRMDKAKQTLLLKNKIIHKNLEHGMLPFMNQKIDDKGTRYLEPDLQSYIIGFIGMNEMAKVHTGMEMHESDDAWKFALRVMKRMNEIVAQFRSETKLTFSLARTPAESSGERLAKIDYKNYGSRAVFQGDIKTDSIYYTNSFHVRPSANIPLFRRLQIEGAFHPLTDGGAMSHIWLSEAYPDPNAIYELTKKIATKTAIQYFAYTKDLSVCENCGTTTGGLIKLCPKCGSENMQWWSRITGYYQNVTGWNKGKLEELKDRTRYGI